MKRSIARAALISSTILWPQGPAAAQTPAAGDAAASEIIVTGTRARDRTVLDSPVPVDVFTPAEVQQAGASGELAQSLQILVPSLNFPRQSNSGAGDTVRAAQLRGLSPDQTLVLVNGKRYHTTSVPNFDTKVGRGTTPVDFNTIPLNAVGRIEVLRDGAGAQYGSDAIAGVVNIILDRSTGFAAGTSYGLNVTKPESTGQRVIDGQTFNADLKFGAKVGADGFIVVGGDYLLQKGTNRAGFDEGGQFLTGGSYSDPRNDQFFGRQLFKVGDPRVEGGHVWYNAELPLGDATFYSSGIGHYRKALGANFFRWPVLQVGSNSDGSDVNYLPPVQPNGLGGFRPQSDIRNRDLSVTTGLRADLGGWRVDGSVTYGTNRVTYRLRDSVNYSLGAASPTAFELSRIRSTQTTANLDISRDVAARTTLSFGAEYRRETWRSFAGDPAAYAVGPLADPAILAASPDLINFQSGADLFGLTPGAQAGPGLTPEDQRRLSRDVVAGYVELSSQPVDAVFVDLAGRVEHYSGGPGTSYAGKAAARWEFIPGFALRGSVSNSFKAPSLAQLGASSTSLTFVSGGVLGRVATLPVDSAAAIALGARRLRPEKSFNISGGLTISPIPDLRLSVDAFRIRTDRRITLSERFDLSGLTPAQATTLGVDTYDAVNFFTNAVDLKTEGVEAVATWKKRLASGTLGLNASYSYAKNRIRRVAATPALPFGLSGNLIGLEESNTLTTAVPRTKIILGADWTGDTVTALVRGTRFGSVTRVFDFGGGFAPSQTFPNVWSFDTEVGFKVDNRFTLAIGANNLFDKYPPLSSSDINGAGNLAYDVLSPVGINGRFLYVRARVGW